MAMPVHSLLADGTLTIEGPESLLTGWLPHQATPAARASAHLVIEGAPLGAVALASAPTLTLLDVGAWVEGDGVLLRSTDGRQDGILELAGPGGTLGVAAYAHIEPLLTIATALVLGRMGRALIHAAGLVAPDGKVLLFVGDTHAGKSTTAATLVRAGWRWLADDQVVLREAGGSLTVEGWARRPNLDLGYATGEVTGRRVGADFARVPTVGSFPFGGIVLPQVKADRPTQARMASASDAFTALVRQSPWLLADVAVASAIQRLLVAAASAPARHLSLGRDSYGDPAVLTAALAAGV